MAARFAVASCLLGLAEGQARHDVLLVEAAGVEGLNALGLAFGEYLATVAQFDSGEIAD